MEQLDLGQATIVYDDPAEGQTEMTVDNEQLVYAQDHWVLVVGSDEEGNDQMRHLPRDRVYHVDRNVEQFEEEVATIRHRVESLANDLRERLPLDIGGQRRERPHAEEPPSTSTTVQIDTEDVEDEATEPDTDAKAKGEYEEQAEES